MNFIDRCWTINQCRDCFYFFTGPKPYFSISFREKIKTNLGADLDHCVKIIEW